MNQLQFEVEWGDGLRDKLSVELVVSILGERGTSKGERANLKGQFFMVSVLRSNHYFFPVCVRGKLYFNLLLILLKCKG